MRKLLLASVLALFTSFLVVPALAQTNDVYQVSPYFLNATERNLVVIVNPGETGTPLSPDHGNVCADIYVFDRNQEMLACCSCKISANGEDFIADAELIGNSLTGVTPTDGVIKIISDAGANCNEQSPVPTPDLRAWLRDITLIPAGLPGAGLASARSEFPFAQVTLQPQELQFLGQTCSFVQYLGSGRGRCFCNQPT